jgi:hypothetical protein
LWGIVVIIFDNHVTGIDESCLLPLFKLRIVDGRNKTDTHHLGFILYLGINYVDVQFVVDAHGVGFLLFEQSLLTLTSFLP